MGRGAGFILIFLSSRGREKRFGIPVEFEIVYIETFRLKSKPIFDKKELRKGKNICCEKYLSFAELV